MSWFARSIANTLSLNDDDDEENDTVPNPNPDSNPKTKLQSAASENDTSSSSSPRGVKEDLSELTKTLTRQFWGVASFLAPPPETEPYKPLNQISDPKSEVEERKSGRNSDIEESDTIGIAGFRSDLSEIGGKFKSGISKLSENINVSEITKMASSLLLLRAEDDEEAVAEGSAVGVTEEVVAFAKDIAMHPGTWLDFPLQEYEVEEEFDMSDAQQEHALAVERLAPRLAALRIELCPGYMSESCFWKIYFVLLHPRLDKEDAALLSTPQVMEARASLAAELQNLRKAKLDNKSREVTVDSEGNSSSQHEVSLSVPSSGTSEAAAECETDKHPIRSIEIPIIDKIAISSAAADTETDKHPIGSIEIPIDEKSAISSAAANTETDKHPITSTEIQIVDKSTTEVEQRYQNEDQNMHSGPSQAWESKDEDDGDDWLKDETSETDDVNGTSIHIENEEDISFSDIEEDDIDALTIRKVNWVQL